jgi:RNA polymerase sigma factor (sigma-70 family)
MLDRREPNPQEQLFADRDRFHKRLVEHFGGKLTWEDAEDLTATAVSDVASTSDDGRTSVERTEWFWSVLKRDAIDLMRSRGQVAREGRKARPRTVALVLEDDDEQGDESRERLLATDDLGFAEVEDAMDLAYDRGEAVKVARKGLAALSKRDRAMIRLRYDEGLTLKGLSAELGISEGHVSKVWKDALIRFRDAVAGVGVTSHDSECGVLRLIVASREIDVVDPEGIARWEVHLEQCTSCRVWDFAGKQAAGAIPMLPMGSGLVGGLVGKLGLGGLTERIHASAEQVAAAVGVGGGGAGAGAGVLGAIGPKAAATCITAAVCVSAGAYVAVPVVERAVTPHKGEHRDAVAAKSKRSQAAGGSGAQRPTTTVSSAPASAAPQVARKATRTQASVQTTKPKRKQSVRQTREQAQATQARATGSPFTPEANDPAPTARAAVAPAPASTSALSSSSAPAPDPTPSDASNFSGQFSP